MDIIGSSRNRIGIIAVKIEIPPDEIIHKAISIIIHTVFIIRIKNPLTTGELNCFTIAIKILTHILPDIIHQIFMVPVNTGINYCNHNFFGSIFSLVNIPCRICFYLCKKRHIFIHGIIWHLTKIVNRNRFRILDVWVF